jgi:prevent-host-death family protein
VVPMSISITDGIRSITDLKRNTNQILQQVHDTKQPVVLTVNGKAEAVLMDAKEYEKTTDALAMMKMILSAEEDIKNNRFMEAETFFKEFRREKKI